MKSAMARDHQHNNNVTAGVYQRDMTSSPWFSDKYSPDTPRSRKLARDKNIIKAYIAVEFRKKRVLVLNYSENSFPRVYIQAVECSWRLVERVNSQNVQSERGTIMTI